VIRSPALEQEQAIVQTPRLLLIAWNSALVDAFAANDSLAAADALAIGFPDPFGPPPETSDVMDFFRRMIEDDQSGGAFLPRMIVRTSDRLAVGSIGLLPPDQAGEIMIGYSVYPQFEGHGFASEAATGLVEWGLGLDGVTAIVATIPVGHVASETVATRAGLTVTGRQVEDEGVTLNVWERRRS
jgi:RimJ/RimL family protein N-acetyltransferase